MNYLNKSKEELIQEITQLKQQVNQQEAQIKVIDALQDKQLHHDLILDMTHEGILVALGLHLVFANKKIYELTGYSETELKEIPFIELIHPDDRLQTITNYKKRLENNEATENYEIRIINRNKEFYWVEVRGTRIMWKGEVATLNFIRDITEAKKYAQALTESEAKFRYITEHSSDVIWHMDANLICDYISLADEKMRGFKQEEVIGTHLYSILRPGTYDRLLANLNKRLQDEKNGIKTTIAPTYELEQICKDGSWVWVETTAMPHHNEEGKFVGIHGVTRDITDRKKIEALIKHQNEQLKNANHEKDRFVSILAHDLRSPFSAMLGLIDLVVRNKNTYSPEKTSKYLSVIQETANNTYHFLEDLLLWAQSQTLPFKLKENCFNTLCQETITNMSSLASNKNISIINKTSAKLQLRADGNMLKTILRNLLSNAIKHTHQGGEIIIDSNYDTRGNLWFSVSDNGVGMHPDITLSLFNNTDKYTSLGTANEIGSGFGLVLCKELIDKHGGKIEVVSHENIGSTFTVTLPAKQETHQHLNTCLETN